MYQLFPATVSTMASNVNKMYSLDQLWSMTSSNLRHILRENKQNVSGNKQILVARCYALNPVEDERKIRKIVPTEAWMLATVLIHFFSWTR